MKFPDSAFNLGITLVRDSKMVWHKATKLMARTAKTKCDLDVAATQFASPRPAYCDENTKWCSECFPTGEL